MTAVDIGTKTPAGAQRKADAVKLALETQLAELELLLGSLPELETTAKDNLVAAINEIKQLLATHLADDAKRIKVKKSVVILAAGWILNPTSQLYEYNHSDADITADTVADVNIKVTDLEKAGELKSANESFNGYLTLYAESKPTENITCDLKLIRQVF